MNSNLDLKVLDTDYIVHSISGQVKWFDPIKGYGFILPEDKNMSDILLHITHLREIGRVDAPKGSTIVCDVVSQKKGFQVIKIVDFDVKTAPSFQERSGSEVNDVILGLKYAKVKWFDSDRRYGFVNIGSYMIDIFLHADTLSRCGLAAIKTGDQFWVRCGHGPKGVVVTDVYLSNNRGQDVSMLEVS